jgi:hypothetical protein
MPAMDDKQLANSAVAEMPFPEGKLGLNYSNHGLGASLKWNVALEGISTMSRPTGFLLSSRITRSEENPRFSANLAISRTLYLCP